MDWGDLLTGLCIGTGAGVVLGMCVPEDKKGEWIKQKQNHISAQWAKYEKTKAKLEKERDEYLADRKNKKKG
jgi:hypothetical protein